MVFELVLQENDGWEVNDPGLDWKTKGWVGPRNNDKDVPPAAGLIPAAP